MSPLLFACVGFVGGLGAIARFQLDGWVSRSLAGSFPWGTFAVNVSGTLALGIAIGAGLSGDARRIAAVGALGAFTTFSTWMHETQRLAEDGETRLALSNLLLSAAIGLLTIWVGREIGRLL